MVTYLGSLVQLCCGEEGALQTNILASVGGARSAWATLGFPCSWHMCFPSLHCSGSRLLCRELSKVGPRLCALPGLSCSGSDFGYSTKAQIRLGLQFAPFPGPSSSGDQVLGECSLPSWVGHFNTSPVPASWFPGCIVRVPS